MQLWLSQCKSFWLSYLPFLMVSLPSRGPSTGSSVSSKFSISTTSPAARALSIASRYLPWEKTVKIYLSKSCTKKLPCVQLTMKPLTLFVRCGLHAAPRHICFWSTWCPVAEGPPWEASAGKRWEWLHFQWTSCQQAALRSATLQCQHHPSAWSVGPSQESLGWEPYRR